MYKIVHLKPEELAKIQVNHQDKIQELTGSKLDPFKAFEVLKRESKGFKENNKKVAQADKLFVDLLKQNGVFLSVEKGGNKIAIRERERKRTIELMELELNLLAA